MALWCCTQQSTTHALVLHHASPPPLFYNLIFSATHPISFILKSLKKNTEHRVMWYYLFHPILFTCVTGREKLRSIKFKGFLHHILHYHVHICVHVCPNWSLQSMCHRPPPTHTALTQLGIWSHFLAAASVKKNGKCTARQAVDWQPWSPCQVFLNLLHNTDPQYLGQYCSESPIFAVLCCKLIKPNAQSTWLYQGETFNGEEIFLTFSPCSGCSKEK